MTDPSSLPADSLDQAATRMGGESRTDSPEQRTPGDTLASLGQLDTGTDSRSSLTVLPDGQARFTTHLTDPPMAITYLGECK